MVAFIYRQIYVRRNQGGEHIITPTDLFARLQARLSSPNLGQPEHSAVCVPLRSSLLIDYHISQLLSYCRVPFSSASHQGIVGAQWP